MTKEETTLLIDRFMDDSLSEEEYKMIEDRLTHPSPVIRTAAMTSLAAMQAYKRRSK